MTGYVLEAVVMVAVSLVLAAGVTVLFQRSSFASLISCSTAFADNVGEALSAVALGLLVAVVSSLYPAFYITSFSPALALKGCSFLFPCHLLSAPHLSHCRGPTWSSTTWDLTGKSFLSRM